MKLNTECGMILGQWEIWLSEPDETMVLSFEHKAGKWVVLSYPEYAYTEYVANREMNRYLERWEKFGGVQYPSPDFWVGKSELRVGKRDRIHFFLDGGFDPNWFLTVGPLEFFGTKWVRGGDLTDRLGKMKLNLKEFLNKVGEI